VSAPDRPRHDADRRLHFVIGGRCNNNCIFCMEEDRPGRQRRVEALTREDLEAMLQANVALGEVMFVSAEPTLSPWFLPMVARARELGYTTVGVISNGRLFAYPEFTRRALDAGLNLAMLSIHGPSARLHDGLTRTPGSFDQVMKGLANLTALGRGRVVLRTSTVICRRNWEPEVLLEHSRLLGPRVQQMVLNVMQPFGRGLAHIDSLMPVYSELVPRLARFYAGRQEGMPPAYLVDIPYCCTEDAGIPQEFRGFVERYIFYDRAGPGVPGQDPQADAPLPPLALLSRDQEDSFHKVRFPFCRDCRYSATCEGVWKGYVARFGQGEFAPVAPA
jgi:MoaA/NifB/PqqE/SkfB family radical SAM enzyme